MRGCPPGRRMASREQTSSAGSTVSAAPRARISATLASYCARDDPSASRIPTTSLSRSGVLPTDMPNVMPVPASRPRSRSR